MSPGAPPRPGPCPRRLLGQAATPARPHHQLLDPYPLLVRERERGREREREAWESGGEERGGGAQEARDSGVWRGRQGMGESMGRSAAE